MCFGLNVIFVEWAARRKQSLNAQVQSCSGWVAVCRTRRCISACPNQSRRRVSCPARTRSALDSACALEVTKQWKTTSNYSRLRAYPTDIRLTHNQLRRCRFCCPLTHRPPSSPCWQKLCHNYWGQQRTPSLHRNSWHLRCQHVCPNRNCTHTGCSEKDKPNIRRLVHCVSRFLGQSYFDRLPSPKL